MAASYCKEEDHKSANKRHIRRSQKILLINRTFYLTIKRLYLTLRLFQKYYPMGKRTSNQRVYWNLQDVADSDIEAGRSLLQAIMEHFDLSELHSVTVGRNLKQVERQAANGSHYKLCGLHEYGNANNRKHRPKECRIYINLDGKDGYGTHCTAIEVAQVPTPIAAEIASIIQGANNSSVQRIGKANYGSKFFDKNGVQRIRWTRDRVIYSAAEGLLWVGLHELYHFLRFTRQIRGIDSDLYADQFADVIFEYAKYVGWFDLTVRNRPMIATGAITLGKERLRNLRREWPLPIPRRM